MLEQNNICTSQQDLQKFIHDHETYGLHINAHKLIIEATQFRPCDIKSWTFDTCTNLTFKNLSYINLKFHNPIAKICTFENCEHVAIDFTYEHHKNASRITNITKCKNVQFNCEDTNMTINANNCDKCDISALNLSEYCNMKQCTFYVGKRRINLSAIRFHNNELCYMIFDGCIVSGSIKEDNLNEICLDHCEQI